MRCAVTSAPATFRPHAVRNGNASPETSSSVAPWSTSRAAGPHIPMTARSVLASRSATGPSSGSTFARSQPRSESTTPAPVTTRNRSSPSRVTVTSATIPPRAVQKLRVDDASRVAVDPVAGDAFEQGQSAGALDIDLAERGHVDQADAIADRGVLRGHVLEPRRPHPAELALVGSRAPPGLPRVEVVRALPAVLGAERRAGFLEPAVERREAVRPAPLVGVERVAEAVVVLVDLAAGGLDLGGRPVRGAEPPRAVAARVELGLAGRHPLGDRLSDTACAAEAVQREAGRHPVPGGARHAGPAAGCRRASWRRGGRRAPPRRRPQGTGTAARPRPSAGRSARDPEGAPRAP